MLRKVEPKSCICAVLSGRMEGSITTLRLAYTTGTVVYTATGVSSEGRLLAVVVVTVVVTVCTAAATAAACADSTVGDRTESRMAEVSVVPAGGWGASGGGAAG